MADHETDTNSNALRYWEITGYTDEDIDAYGKKYDADFMFAKVFFTPGEEPNLTISTKTWKLQEGHYGAILRFFKYLATTEIGKTLSGYVMVYLEDGLFDYTRNITRQVPFLAFGRSIDDTFGLLMPDPAFLYSDGYCEEFTKIVEYENSLTEPKQNRIFWRGAASGTSFHDENWMLAARGRLVYQANKINDSTIIDAKLTKLNHLPEAQQAMFSEMGFTAEYTDFYDFLKYKYLIDVDGYHCAWKSLFLKLASRSLVIKVQSDLEQWYYHLLKPWQHYVPLRSDCSDIREVFNWIESHPEEVARIICNANLLVDRITIQKEAESVALLCKKIISFKRSRP